MNEKDNDLGTAATVLAPAAQQPGTASDKHTVTAKPQPGVDDAAMMELAATQSDEMQLPPSINDRFDNLELLGRGGMGTVYRGWDKQLARGVALKFVHGHDAARFFAGGASVGAYQSRQCVQNL